jgi:molecular chaperone Hsp33
MKRVITAVTPTAVAVMNHSDTLQRFVFEHAPIRGEIVRLDATWHAVLERRAYPPAVRDLLGEFMAAAALLVTTLKFKGRLIMQAQGDGPVPLLVVESSSERAMRALAQWRGEVQSAPLAELLGGGQIVITIEPEGLKERYQGIVALHGETVAQALEHYFETSEQLATRLWLAADSTQAAGFLLQKLPHRRETDPDAWNRAVLLGDTVKREELLRLPARAIVRRLYHEEDIRLFAGQPVSFRCSCSRDRVDSVLRMLGEDEVRSIVAERGSVGVDCEFCGAHYEVDTVDAAQLFAAPVAQSARPTRH